MDLHRLLLIFTPKKSRQCLENDHLPERTGALQAHGEKKGAFYMSGPEL